MKLYKVKPGKVAALKKWGAFLNANAGKVKRLLKQENCSREFFYLFKIGRSYYAIIHMEGGPFKTPNNDPINQKHKKVLKDCLEPRPLSLKTLYDFSAN
ncbi:MAG TPA: DUF6176 family protein [Patescibacteria group bacterium]|nr:DUF6176 family protein [Patescibacteria group bacterium]